MGMLAVIEESVDKFLSEGIYFKVVAALTSKCRYDGLVRQCQHHHHLYILGLPYHRRLRTEEASSTLSSAALSAVSLSSAVSPSSVVSPSAALLSSMLPLFATLPMLFTCCS